MLTTIVNKINARARSHPVSRLQQIRKGLKGLDRIPTRKLFSTQTTFDHYAFHHGGRTELQFNVGLEEIGDKQHLRHGVAFSFEPSGSLGRAGIDIITELSPRVDRFNEFLRLNPEEFLGLRMWHWDTRRSDDREPSRIPRELCRLGLFVFLGRHRATEEGIDYEAILKDFDRLLPLYQFVQGSACFPTVTPIGSGFHFEAGFIAGPTRTTANIVGGLHEVDLLHQQIKEALHRALSHRFGAGAVSSRELPNGIGGRLDTVVRQGGGYWFYEIKTAMSARACIREALGQVLEYSYWPGTQEAIRLIIVGEPELDDEARKYLAFLRQRFSLPVYYQQIDFERAVLIPAELDS
jgi:hypothetical protein